MTASIADHRIRSLVRAHSPHLRGTATPIDEGQRLDALGVDSLELLSLAADLEREFDVDLDTAALTSADTVGALIALVAAARAGAPE